ncbi:MAG: purine-nucleoside phosphorylase [Oscillospiraceae bacterium]|jgi:purine-nucleoside phosphorylase
MAEFNGTPHNTAKLGEIAKTVVMPGDPLRAKFIAENFLTDAKEFNHVRGMLGYTGKYKGVTVSTMGHGMGIPSIGIYSYELFHFYDVQNIIRVGSCGGLLPEMDLFDVVLEEAAYSQSTYAKVAFGYDGDLMYPSKELTDKLEETAKALGKHIFKGIASSGDVFYRDPNVKNECPYKIIAGEMEGFGLFANAKYTGKNAACLLTISDKKDAVTTPQERQTAFTNMIEIALETAIKL